MQEPWIILDRQALKKIPEILRGTKSHSEWSGVSFRINNKRKTVPTKPCGNIILRGRLYKGKSKYIFKSVMTL